MQTKFYCSNCGCGLKVVEVKDFSVINFIEIRIMIQPCVECEERAQRIDDTEMQEGEWVGDEGAR